MNQEKLLQKWHHLVRHPFPLFLLNILLFPYNNYLNYKFSKKKKKFIYQYQLQILAVLSPLPETRNFPSELHWRKKKKKKKKQWWNKNLKTRFRILFFSSFMFVQKCTSTEYMSIVCPENICKDSRVATSQTSIALFWKKKILCKLRLMQWSHQSNLCCCC